MYRPGVSRGPQVPTSSPRSRRRGGAHVHVGAIAPPPPAFYLARDRAAPRVLYGWRPPAEQRKCGARQASNLRSFSPEPTLTAIDDPVQGALDFAHDIDIRGRPPRHAPELPWGGVDVLPGRSRNWLTTGAV
jgi:hypothetical protein